MEADPFAEQVPRTGFGSQPVSMAFLSEAHSVSPSVKIFMMPLAWHQTSLYICRQYKRLLVTPLSVFLVVVMNAQSRAVTRNFKSHRANGGFYFYLKRQITVFVFMVTEENVHLFVTCVRFLKRNPFISTCLLFGDFGFSHLLVSVHKA